MAIKSSKVPPRSTSRKFGKIEENQGVIACDRVVPLPFDLATVYTAAQNFRIDLAKGYHTRPSDWVLVQASYMQEALEVLQEQGCGLYPGENNEPWITVRVVGNVPMPSPRAMSLSLIFTFLFVRNDVSLFTSKYFPHPAKINTAEAIKDLQTEINSVFVYH
jgi:hypothetical protein